MPTWTGFQSKSFKTSTETNITNGGRLIGGLTVARCRASSLV